MEIGEWFDLKFILSFPFQKNHYVWSRVVFICCMLWTLSIYLFRRTSDGSINGQMIRSLTQNHAWVVTNQRMIGETQDSEFLLILLIYCNNGQCCEYFYCKEPLHLHFAFRQSKAMLPFTYFGFYLLTSNYYYTSIIY